MFQSRNFYTFTISKNIPEIKEQLLRNTLNKKHLIRELTDKRFIGQIHDDGFWVVGSSAISVICTLNGKFNKVDEQTTVIEIETKIHKAFLILLACFTIVIGLLSIGGYVMEHHSFSFIPFVPVLMAALFFRLFLHVTYVRARNASIKDFEKTVE